MCNMCEENLVELYMTGTTELIFNAVQKRFELNVYDVDSARMAYYIHVSHCPYCGGEL